MTRQISLKTPGATNDSYLYIETLAGESYAVGSDSVTDTFCINSQATAGASPDEATANITINPIGDIDVLPNGAGKINLHNVASGTVSNKNYVTINTSTGELGSDAGAGGSGVTTIDGDTGSATGSTIDFTASTQSTSVSFIASGSTVELEFVNSTGDIIIGDLSSSNTTNNVALGGAAFYLGSGSYNCAVGFGALNGNTGNNNCVFGGTSLINNAGSSNCCLGGGIGNPSSGLGDFNVMIGESAGLYLDGTSDSNVYINYTGSAPDPQSNTLRIGDDTGTGNRELNRAFIAGITGITPGGSTISDTIIDENGQLGSESRSSFFAQLTAIQSGVTGDGTTYTIIPDTALSNVGSDYNTSTGQYTAPSTGLYSFAVSITINNLSALNTQSNSLIFIGSKIYFIQFANSFAVSASGILTLNGSIDSVPMTVGQTAEIRIQVDGSPTPNVNVYGDTPGYTWFSGKKEQGV